LQFADITKSISLQSGVISGLAAALSQQRQLEHFEVVTRQLQDIRAEIKDGFAGEAFPH
jgi:hypothetical protein